MNYAPLVSGLFSILVLIVMSGQTVPARQTPEASLAQVQQALDSRDSALFERRVDVDGLVTQGVALLEERLREADTNGRTLPPALALMAGSLRNPSLAPAVREMLIRELSAFVRSGIASGSLNGGSRQQARSDGMLARFLPAISTGRKTLRAHSAPRMEQEGCVMTATLHDAGNGSDYPLELFMQPEDDAWKVRQVRNMRALLKQLEAEVSTD